ncbi:tetratricopeptide repeat protein [Fulvivirga sp. M361]|uniref:tetratricopeptide repeat-containing sensor histidine kinase n=1 Tax=Fulvivirga sp. M361 TaxID=2594266 RepID=UPI001627E36E|nr:tetratricopeptide repeat protein [Fulvivirga sp. M361]
MGTLVYSQHSKTIDSLYHVLATDLNASKRAYVLDELSYQWFTRSLDSSLYYGRLAYQAFEVLEEPKGLSQSATSVAVAFHYLNQWDSAAYYYKQALQIRRDSKDTAKVASSLNNLGVMFMSLEEYKVATDHYIEAMRVREQLYDSLGVAITKFNLGLICKKQGNYPKAISYYMEAKEVFEHFGKSNYLETSLLNLGSIYNTIGDFEKGVFYNLKLVRLAEERASQRNLAKAYVNLGNAYQGSGQLDSGLYYVKKGLTFFQLEKDTLNISHSLLSIAQLYFDKKDFNNAITYSEKVDDYSKNLNNNELMISNQLLIAQAYASKGRYRQAYDAMKQSFEQKDSLLNTSLNETITELTLKYETEQKEKEIATLKIENQQAEIEQQRSVNQRNVFIFIAGLLILGTVLLYLLLKAKSRANAVILQSLADKETLLKEIHHRVKNNLQVISSLLSLQSRFMDDDGARKAVNEGQNRVKSMALIHQKLYQHDNLSGVEALDYIQNLAGSLRAAYGIDGDRVAVDLDVDELNIDVDTIIPIGLILNELISNSFKHAFPDGRKGQICIGLKSVEGKLKLTVKDDGIGNSDIKQNTETFGLRMITSLSRKLDATIATDHEHGTATTLSISSYKLV